MYETPWFPQLYRPARLLMDEGSDMDEIVYTEIKIESEIKLKIKLEMVVQVYILKKSGWLSLFTPICVVVWEKGHLGKNYQGGTEPCIFKVSIYLESKTIDFFVFLNL